MIMMVGKDKQGNTLHIIRGEETELFEAVNGQLSIDITELLNEMDPTRPVHLHITTCKSEAQVEEQIKQALQRGAEYPFLPHNPLFVLTPEEPDTGLYEDMAMSEAIRRWEEAGTKRNPAPPVKRGRQACTRCASKTARLVPGLSPAICYTCAKIDLHNAAHAGGKGVNKDAGG